MNQQQLITDFQKSRGLTDQATANYLKYSVHTIRRWKRPALNSNGEPNRNYAYMSEPVYDYVKSMIDKF